MIRVRCRHCGTRFQVRESDAGKRGRCPAPECRKPFRVPEPEPAGDPFDVDADELDAEPAAPAPPRRPGRTTSGKTKARPAGKSRKLSGRKKKRSGKGNRGLPFPRLIGGALVLTLVLLVSIVWLWPSGEREGARGQLAAAETGPPEKNLDFVKDIKPLLHKYCSDCHGDGYEEGEVGFHRYNSLADIHNDRETWVKVFKLLKVGAMPPPAEADLPSDEERQKIVNWIDYQLFYVDCTLPHEAGRVTLRRLNRTEYDNTVRDLLGVDFKPAADFPSDDVGYGFDNIGDVLSVQPLLIEKYLDAAEQIAAKAIPVRHPEHFKRRVSGSSLKHEGHVNDRGGQKHILSRGHAYETFEFKAEGEYVIRIEAAQDQAGDEDAKMEVKLGDKVVEVVEVKEHREPNDVTLKVQAVPGKHKLSAAFLNDFYDKNLKVRNDRNLYVRYIEVEGPFGIPEKVRKSNPLIRETPRDGVPVEQAARANLREFLPRAFRRPVSEEELERFSALAGIAAEHGEPFEMAMRLTLQGVLVSPEFLFRVEDGRRREGNREMLDDFALASRLSYFLWSSMPDDELFELAKENRLHDPKVLERQTRRMLKDPKIGALVENFPGQWLGLRKLMTTDVEPDPELFPEFTERVRLDYWRETELFFGSIVQGDKSIYDLLDGKYTFVNERLAKLYGIDGIKGDEFQRVSLEGTDRGGLLTHGSILTLTSYPNRTSPVKRGEWVLENLLGDAPPDAPPIVPGLEEVEKANPGLSFREQLERHRSDPGCASCHNLMDDIGFGLQNFDPIGRWRTQEGEHPVDASGTLPSGESFEGPMELIQILRNRKEQFGRCVTEKLLTYAIGRGTEYYDRCAVDEIMGKLDQDDRFSTLVLGIVNSAPFQMRQIDENRMD